MSTDELPAPLERILAAMLRHGTSLASSVIALGLGVAVPYAAAGMRIAALGIALFIALPVARVVAMMVFFARSRDYRFSGIAALVLAIITFSYLVGAR
jgi:uncharacterized membrane protein